MKSNRFKSKLWGRKCIFWSIINKKSFFGITIKFFFEFSISLTFCCPCLTVLNQNASFHICSQFRRPLVCRFPSWRKKPWQGLLNDFDLPYCLAKRELLNVDILYGFFSGFWQMVAKKIAQFCCLLVSLLIVWQAVIGARDMIDLLFVCNTHYWLL